MYAAQANSPYAELTGGLDTSVSEIHVNDASVLPDEAPFLLTIGFDTSTSETVLVTDISGNQLTVVRGVDGPAQVWVAGVKCARVFTAKDLNDLQENIRTLLDSLNSVGTKVGTATLDTSASDLSAAINEHEADIVNLALSLANEYAADTQAGYSVGDYCTHNNRFYRCNTVIAAGGEPWTAAHWTAVNFADLLKAAQGKIGTATLDTSASDLSAAINEHEADITAIQTMLSDILPAAWSAKAYAVGDVVVRNNKLYQANTATSTNWVSSQWTQVRIGNAAVLTYTEI